MYRLIRPGWWLVLLAILPLRAVAQRDPSTPPPRAELKENYPNPFYPATTIPFTVFSDVCRDDHQPVVTLRILNVLAQVVAIPTLVDAPRVPVENLSVECGDHEARWNGAQLSGETEPTPGIYFYRLTVDGDVFTRKMIVSRDAQVGA
jgi:hypothetical protein